MAIGWDAAYGVNWFRLTHAYGRAVDTPGYLRNLTSADRDVRIDAIEHLQSEVLHQGNVYPATPIAIRIIAGLLNEPVLREAGSDQLTMLNDLLSFIGWSALGTSEQLEFHDSSRSTWMSSIMGDRPGRAVRELSDAAPDVADAVIPFADDDDYEVRQDAIAALARLGRASTSTDLQGRLLANLISRTDQDRERDGLANLILAIGHLDGDTVRWLDHADPAVRSCAAVSLPENARATAVLVEALTKPAEVNKWFSSHPPMMERKASHALVGALLERSPSFDEILPAALAVVEAANIWGVDSDWGPLLRVAFPGAEPKRGTPPPPMTGLSEGQRELLRVLVDNESLWDPKNGNASLALRRAGLPNDRKAVAAMIDHTFLERPRPRWRQRPKRQAQPRQQD